MPSNRRIAAPIALVSTLTAAMLVGCAGGAGEATTDPEVAIKDACGPCHSMEFLAKQSDDLDWEKTVDRMIKQRGAALSDADKPAVIEYLKVQNEGD